MDIGTHQVEGETKADTLVPLTAPDEERELIPTEAPEREEIEVGS